MATAKARVGYIGVGNIFPRYVEWSRRFNVLEPVACADLDETRAAQRAAEYNIEARSMDDLLASDDIDVVVNLTVPKVHAEVDQRIIAAGKHVYAEKPLGTTLDEARAVLDAAESAGVRVGSAPDTFLGGGLQTCRKVIDEGWIGTPIAATAFMMSRGIEMWHPNPEFFYKPGGGPLLDMGPYYITALVSLLGPVRRVTASTQAGLPQRTVTSQPNFGQVIEVDVTTHDAGILDFHSGVIATTILSFDVWQHSLPRIEIYGTRGTLRVPDPNTFGGPVELWLETDREWRAVPLAYSSEVERGIGLADMMQAAQDDRPHRASGQLAYHALEVMMAFNQSSESGTHVAIESRPDRPEPLPAGLLPGDVALRD